MNACFNKVQLILKQACFRKNIKKERKNDEATLSSMLPDINMPEVFPFVFIVVILITLFV